MKLINILILLIMMLDYYPFSIEDKKYWQFYKQRKDELNPKKKNSKVRFDIFRRPLPNRHQYHRSRRLHHQLRLQRPMAARNHYRYLQYDSYDPLAQVCNWTSMPTVRRGCITTSSGIMSLMQVGLLIRIRLGWLVEDSMNGSPFQWRINWKEQKLNVVPS